MLSRGKSKISPLGAKAPPLFDRHHNFISYYEKKRNLRKLCVKKNYALLRPLLRPLLKA